MRRLTAAAAVAAALLLIACSPDAADFKSAAEKYIESRDFSEKAGQLRYTEAVCDEPASTAEDTTYRCIATADDGSTWRFEVVITGDSDLEVVVPPTPVSAATTDSSLPDGSTPTSTAASTTTTTTTTA